MKTLNAYCAAKHSFDKWAPSIMSLTLRLWLSSVFFKSGLTKLASWDTTLALFNYEYQVPVVSASVAALSATGVELVIPVLLVIGLFTRTSSLVLLILNVVAVISYPDVSDAGIQDHVFWGVMLTALIAYGGGRVTVDDVWRRWFRARNVA